MQVVKNEVQKKVRVLTLDIQGMDVGILEASIRIAFLSVEVSQGEWQKPANPWQGYCTWVKFLRLGRASAVSLSQGFSTEY